MRIWPAAVLVSVSVAAVILASPLGREELAKRLEAARPGAFPDAGGTAQVRPPPPERSLGRNEAATTGSLERRPAADAPQVAQDQPSIATAAEDLAALLRRAFAPAGARPAADLPQPNPSPPLSPAVVAYRKGDVAALAALARGETDPDRRLGLEWVTLRADPQPAFAALEAFGAAHPGWPVGGYLRTREEADLLVHPRAPAEVIAFFAASAPQSSAGKVALARALGASGHVSDAIGTIRALWRDGDFDAWTEAAILREFGPALTLADHKYRADRLFYAESWGAASRAAALAGPDEMKLAAARYTAARGPLPTAVLMAVPNALKSDPGLLFARVQDARRAGRTYEAATLLGLAPTDRDALVDPNRWWDERRMVARQLLDLNEPRLAFELCARAAAPEQSSGEVDRQFHAGWIALRFLGDAPEAAKRFALAAVAAETPLSIARAEYWRGRAAEAMGEGDEAILHYQNAATEPAAYYGQLAAERLGVKRLALRKPLRTAEGLARNDAVRAAEALYAEGLTDVAKALAYEAARSWRDEAQIAAMAEVVERRGDAATQVQFGKLAMSRGYAFDAMAFPASGVPAFLPLAHSADLASVYAVARQESEFVWQASSGAGAKGLMQILPSTAAMTARRAGVNYDFQRLLVDPAFNTQLGAAFLGQVMEDLNGSPELAFAAYNAGPGRVARWIAAYGDPRNGADMVDWVRAHPVRRDARLCRAREREPRRLPSALRRRAADGRSAFLETGEGLRRGRRGVGASGWRQVKPLGGGPFRPARGGPVRSANRAPRTRALASPPVSCASDTA